MCPLKNELWRINFLSETLNAWRVQILPASMKNDSELTTAEMPYWWRTLFKNPSSLEGGTWMKNEKSPNDDSKKMKFPVF